MLYAFTVGSADVSLKTDEYGTRESELKMSRLTLVWLNDGAISDYRFGLRGDGVSLVGHVDPSR